MVTGATGYELKIQKNNEDSATESSAATVGVYTFSPYPITGTEATISGITAGNSYTIEVRAILTGNADKSEWSHSVTHSNEQTVITIDQEPPPPPAPEFASATVTRRVFENSPAGTLIGDPVTATHSNTLIYSISGTTFNINSSTGQISNVNAIGDFDADWTTKSFSMTVTAADAADQTKKADTTVNITVVNLIEAIEEFSKGVISWQRAPNTQFLIAHQGTQRKPEHELNIQPDCTTTKVADGWTNPPHVQMDMWVDGNLLKYRWKSGPAEDQRDWKPVNSEDPDHTEWPSFDLTQTAAPGLRRGLDSSCHIDYQDIWNDGSILYAVDVAVRLIKAYDINNIHLSLSRNPAKDIPITENYYYYHTVRPRGLYGDNSHLWLSSGNEVGNADFRDLAFDRADFKNDPDADIAYQLLEKTQDAHIDGDTIYVLEFNDRDKITPFQKTQGAKNTFGTHIHEKVDSNTGFTLPGSATNPERISGYGSTIFAQIKSQPTLVAANKQTGDPRASEYDQRGLTEYDQTHCANNTETCPRGISTHDGTSMFFSYQDGRIARINKIVPDIPETITWTIPENAPTGLTVGSPIEAAAQLDGSLTWTVTDADDGDDDDDENDLLAFDHTTYGDNDRFFRLITTETPYDYERKDTYTISVTVKDSDNDVDTGIITIKISDVAEPPPPPTGVTAEAGAASIHISWVEPTVPDGVPDIDAYQVEYYSCPSESCSPTGNPNHTAEVGTSTIIPDLPPDNTYKIQVRSKNPEGSSAWVHYANTLRTTYLPKFVVPTRIEAAENQTAVGAFTVTDADTAETITALINGGTDAAQFSITPDAATQTSPAGFTIAFQTAPDFEMPTDNNGTDADGTYEITLSTTSGSGVKQATITKDITIVVTNVNEPSTGQPVITGEPKEDSQLSADTSGITDPDDDTLTSWKYQWKMSDNDINYTAITGATLQNHTATNAEAGKYLIVAASYIETTFGRSSFIDSAPIGPIVDNLEPIIQVPHTYEVTENHTETFTIIAEDTNSEDSIHTFSLKGNDSGDFAITNGGILSFNATPNFESPADNGGNNQYDFDISVTSGEAGRLRTTDQPFTITVTDVDEPPSPPSVFSFSDVHQTYMTVHWNKPDNLGPAITAYNLQYRKQSDTVWINADTVVLNDEAPVGVLVGGILGQGLGRTPLERGTTYEFQANAANDEGTSIYSSPPGIQDTNTNLPPEIKGKPFSLSIAENTPSGQRIGVQIDVDDRDFSDGGYWTFTLEDLADHSGDSAKFDFDANGDKVHIKTKSPIDYETKDSYTFKLKVTDGQGEDGVDTAVVTITVTDVSEPPPRPAAPVVSSGTADRSIDIKWTAPSTDGRPHIQSYQVQYRLKWNSSWTNVPHNDLTTTTTVTGLKAGETYQAQVLAHNDEGDSPWSPIGEGKTTENIHPVFTDTAPINRLITETIGSDTETTARSVGAPVAATDADGGTITYTLRGTDQSAFSVDNSTGQISTKIGRRYDHEGKSSYSVTVRATDSHTDGTSDPTDATVNINIDDELEPPLPPHTLTFSGKTRFSVTLRWRQPANTGRPAIDTYHYRYVASSTEPAEPPIQNLKTTNSIDTGSRNFTGLEAGTKYYFSVRANNSEGDSPWSDWAHVTTDANAEPAFDSNTNMRSVAENSAQGADVGATIHATDADNDTLTYSITGANAGGFDIVSTTGQIKVGAITHDYENENSYTVYVTATEIAAASASTTQTVTVTIADINEPPDAPDAPTVEAGPDPRTLNVQWAAPTHTGRPPIDDYNVQYRKRNSGGWLNWPAVATTSTDTSIVITGLLAATPYQVHVQARNDEGLSSYSSAGTGSTASNQPPSFVEDTTSGLQRSISENSGDTTDTGREVGNAFQATDPDGGTVKFSITGKEATKFSIDADSGQLYTRTGSNYDFEAKRTYEFTISIRDVHTGETTSAVSTTLTIEITDQVEAPLAPAQPSFRKTSRTQTDVRWASPNNSGRPDITSYDYQYAKGSKTAAATEVDAELKTSVTVEELDHGNTYYFQVRASNIDGTGPWSEWADIAIPANRAPTFNSGTTARSIDENTPAATNVGSPIGASDHERDNLTYEIVVDGSTHINLGGFTIDTSNGQLKSGRKYDNEQNYDPVNHTNPTFTITVRTTDTFSAEADQTVTITIADVIEKPGKPATPRTTDQSLTSLSFTWDPPTNTGPPITEYKYRHRKGDSGSWTEATDNTPDSRIVTLSGLDQNSQYQFQVAALNDEGQGPWSAPNETTTKNNQQPIIGQGATATRSVPENTTTAENLGNPFTVTDADGNDGGTIEWSIEDAVNSLFQLTVDASTPPSAQLQTKSGQDFDHESQREYSVTVRVADGQGGSANIKVTVTITNVSEQPGPPDAPSRDSSSLHTITIEWTPPAVNTGPPISDYDVRYITQGAVDTIDSNWTYRNETVADTATADTIESLLRGTTYKFQVRAYNDEQESIWSGSGTFSTLENSAPDISGSENITFRIDENTVPNSDVGTAFSISDDDEDTISLTLSGDDQALFAIKANGQLQTAAHASFDYENYPGPYSVILTADDAFEGQDLVNITIELNNLTEKPNHPDAPTFSGVSSTEMTAFWYAPINTGRPAIDKYGSQHRTGDNQSWNAETEHDANVFSRLLARLTPGTVYWFRVRAHNADGWGEYSDAVPQTAAVNLSPVFDDASDTIQIDLPENTEPNEPVGVPITATDVESADLVYTLGGDDDDYFAIEASTSQIKTKYGVSYNYEAAKNTYSINVITTDEHYTTATKPVTIRLTNVLERPERPAAPTIADQTITTVDLTWTTPANTGPNISDYDIRYIKADLDHEVPENWADSPHDDNSLETTITGLERGITYHFQVNAFNEELRSEWSPSQRSTTTRNADPVFTSVSNNNRHIEVPENTPGGSNIGQSYQATDADADTITYSITGTDAAYFDIDSSSGQLTSLSDTEFNYEQQPNTYRFAITADDANGGTASINISVDETDEEEPPGQPNPVTFHDITATSMTLKWVAPLENTGPPIDQYLLRYAQAEIGPWTDHEFPATTLELLLENLPPSQTYWAQVQARNAEGHGPFSTAVNQSSGDNTPPTFVNADNTVSILMAENTPANQNVGEPVTATDVQTEDGAITYALSGDDASSFDINTGTAQIITTSGTDYNFEVQGTTPYRLTVIATDHHAAPSSKPVEITLTDVIEPPEPPNAPTITEETTTSITITWDEPTNTGPEIITYGVQYLTGTSTQWVTLDHTGTDRSATFNNLVPSQAFSARVNATSDEGTSQWSDPVQTNTLVNQIPTFQPPPELQDPNFANNQYQFEIPENSLPYTEVGTVTAYDPENTAIAYSLGTEPDAAKFAIDLHSGDITTAAAAEFDHETDTAHSFEVTATDAHGDTDAVTVVVNITDVDEPPAPPNLSADDISFDGATINWTPGENTGPPVTAYDIRYRADGDTQYVQLSAGASESSVKLMNLTVQTTYEVSGMATNDEGQSAWSSPITFTTTVNNAPTFSTPSSHVRIDENVPSGTHVIDITASDSDQHELTYTTDGDDADHFSITADNARIVTANAATFDYETRDTYTFTITATDPYQLFSTHHVTVSINNVDEDPTGKPVILGINEVGETLTVDMSDVDDPDGMLNPPTFQYRWTAGGIYLANQTSPEIDLTQIHSGKYIIVEVRFDDAGGNSEIVHSDPFGPIDSSSGQPVTPEPTPEPTPGPTATPTIVATPPPTIAPTKIVTPKPTNPAPTATARPTRRAGGGGGGTTTDSGDDDPTPTPTPAPTAPSITAATPTPTPNAPKPDGPRTFVPVTPTAIFTPTPLPTATVTPTTIRPTATPWGWLPSIRPTEGPTQAPPATPPPTMTPEPNLTPTPEPTMPPDNTVPPEQAFNWWWIIGLLIAAGSAAAAYAAYKKSDRFHDFVNAGARSISDRLGR